MLFDLTSLVSLSKDHRDERYVVISDNFVVIFVGSPYKSRRFLVTQVANFVVFFDKKVVDS